MTKKKKIIITSSAILTLAVIITGIVFSVIYFANDYIQNPILFNHLKDRVENAQYLPDVDNNDMQGRSMRSESDIIEEQEMDELVAQLSLLEGFAAGKRDYTILDIKDEMMFIIDNVDTFNKWVRMPSTISSEKFSYLSNWSFKVTLDPNTQKLSIFRYSWDTVASYYDEDVLKATGTSSVIEKDPLTGKNIEKDVNNPNVYQYSTMQIDYYYEDGDEVVECFLYNALHVEKEVYPVRYQYLKNVKDKSFTKMESIVRSRHNTVDAYRENGGEIHSWSYGLDTLNEFGSSVIISQMEYDDIDNMSFTSIEHYLPDVFDSRPPVTSVSSYEKINGEVNVLNLLWGRVNALDPKYSIIPPIASEFQGYTIGYVVDKEITDVYNSANQMLDAELARDILNWNSNHETSNDMIYGDDEVHILGSAFNPKDFSHHEKSLAYTCDCFTAEANITTSKLAYYYESGDKDDNLSKMIINMTTSVAGIAEALGGNSDDLIYDLDTSLTTFEYQAAIDSVIYTAATDKNKSFYMMQNYDELYSAQKRADEIGVSEKSENEYAYKLSTTNTIASISEGSLLLNTNATYTYNNAYDSKENVYIGLVLSSITSNSYIVLDEHEYNADGGKYQFDSNLLQLPVLGNSTYVVGVALFMKMDDKSVLISNVENISFSDMPAVIIPDAPEADGFVLRHNYFYIEKKLYINHTYIDVAPPVVECPDSVSLGADSIAYDLVGLIKATDNSSVNMIEVYAGVGNISDMQILNYGEKLVSGKYTIAVVDEWGNDTIVVINVTIE